MRVAVAGAGLGGLSAACHLVGRGHDVVVVERAAGPGGRAGRFEAGGYRFDTGPTVLTMVDLLAATFQAAGAQLDDHLRLHRLDPAYRASFADGSELAVRADAAAMAEEIARVCGPADGAAFARFCQWLGELYRLELPNFIDRNYDSPLDLARQVRALGRLVRLGGLRRLESVVRSHFADERLHRLFSFQALYAGLSPFEALALYGVITYMDTVAGVYAAEGGMGAVPAGLAAAARAAGAELRYGAEVERIERHPSGAVSGVRLVGGERVAADVVVANPDLPAVYRDLLGLQPPARARRGRYSPSCLVWLVGARGGLPAGAAHHNIHFGADWRRSFDQLLDGGRPMDDPSILVSAPSLSDPTLAPAGGHALYVLEPVPNLDAGARGGLDWSAWRGPARERLAAQVAGLGYPIDIEVEQLTDPVDWAAQGLEAGTPFSLAHRFFQTGPFRPGNVDAAVPGLVLVGSGTVPGVGVPMVLLSGRLAALRVEEYGKKRGRASRRRPLVEAAAR